MSPAPRRTTAAGKPATRSKPAAKPKVASVVASGPPRRLQIGLPDLPVDALGGAPVEATLKGASISKVSLSLRGLDRGQPPRIKLRVDPLTPPGRYEGTATVAGTTVPIVAEVLPAQSVRTEPLRFEVSARPSESVDVMLTLHNQGNVPTDVPPVSTFPLLDRSGIGDAFYHAIGAPPPEGKQRIDVLLDDLAESNGGDVTATAVKDPAGPIPPGESATISLTLAFSDRLKPGAEYAGAWNIDATHIPVRVVVPSKAPALPSVAVTPAAAARSTVAPKPKPKSPPKETS